MSAKLRQRDQAKVRSGAMTVTEYIRIHGRSPSSHIAEESRETKRNQAKVAQHLTGKATQAGTRKT